MKTVLEQEILEIINCATCSQYTGKLEVTVDDEEVKCGKFFPKWYTLKLYLNLHMSPMVFAYQGTEQEFKDYIKEEMKSRKLQKIFRYEVIRDIILPGDERCEDEE